MLTLDFSNVDRGITVWFVVFALSTAAIAYLFGCFNGAVIVSKYILHDDVRTHGSGNAGLTNFYRTFGGPLTLVVILCDVLKAVLAVLVGMLWANRFLIPLWEDGFLAFLPNGVGAVMAFAKYWSALFCLLGHIFPCMFGFKGGKGILSGGTIAIMIDWRVALLVWGGFLILVALTRYVSLGSVCAAAGFPFGTWFFVSHDVVIMTLAICLGALVIYMHRGNIQRLLKGEERKLSFHKKTS